MKILYSYTHKKFENNNHNNYQLLMRIDIIRAWFNKACFIFYCKKSKKKKKTNSLFTVMINGRQLNANFAQIGIEYCMCIKYVTLIFRFSFPFNFGFIDRKEIKLIQSILAKHLCLFRTLNWFFFFFYLYKNAYQLCRYRCRRCDACIARHGERKMGLKILITITTIKLLVVKKCSFFDY